MNWSNRKRELMYKAYGGNPRANLILQFLDHHVRCEDILEWLVKNNIVGTELVTYHKHECHGSHLLMFETIVSKIDKKERTPTLLGRDWIV